MVNARLGAWTEAYESQNIFSSQISSPIGTCADSVTLKRLRSNLLTSTRAAAMVQTPSSYTDDISENDLTVACHSCEFRQLHSLLCSNPLSPRIGDSAYSHTIDARGIPMMIELQLASRIPLVQAQE